MMLDEAMPPLYDSQQPSSLSRSGANIDGSTTLPRSGVDFKGNATFPLLPPKAIRTTATYTAIPSAIPSKPSGDPFLQPTAPFPLFNGPSNLLEEVGENFTPSDLVLRPATNTGGAIKTMEFSRSPVVPVKVQLRVNRAAAQKVELSHSEKDVTLNKN